MSELMSKEIDQLATALAKAQGEMPIAGKNQKNGFFKSNYADFEAIIEASRPFLSKYGLSVVQPPVTECFEGEDKSYLFTILMHSSGQWIKSKARHNPLKDDIQSLASYNTYLKRMCYSSLVGVATGDDDDGEKSMDRNNTSPQKQPFQQQPSKPKEIIFKVEEVKPIEQPKPVEPVKQEIPVVEKITIDQLKQMDYELDGFPKVKNTVLLGLNLEHFRELPKYAFHKVFNRVRELVQLEREIRNKKEMNG